MENQTFANNTTPNEQVQPNPFAARANNRFTPPNAQAQVVQPVQSTPIVPQQNTQGFETPVQNVVENVATNNQSIQQGNNASGQDAFINAINQRMGNGYGSFRIDKAIYEKSHNDGRTSEDTFSSITPQIRDAAISGVLERMTHIQGTQEEIAAHNEMLNRCVMGDKIAQKNVKALIEKILEKDMRIVQHGAESLALVNYIYRNYYGLGPIDDLVNDPSINEVWVNSYDHIWIEKGGIKQRIKSEFKNDGDILRIIRLLLNFNKMDISVQEPIKEARMLDGSRITILIPPVAKHPCINIRKFDAFEVTTENLVKANTISNEMVPWIERIIEGRSNIMIIGETGSGKTSFLKWLIGLMNPSFRLGTIETNFELKIDEKYPERNIFSYECHEELGIDMNSIFRECLRSSPDIIICGEARGSEADELIKAMRRGHEGSIGTIHTNSAETTITDLHEMINEDGQLRDSKMNCYRIASALNFIVQIRRFDNGARRVTRITEVLSNPNDFTYSLNDIFKFVQDEEDPNNGEFIKVGNLHEETIKKLITFGVPVHIANEM